MKKIISVIIAVAMIVALSGCQFNSKQTEQTDKDLTVELDSNVKLMNVDWKEDVLCILTKPMTKDDEAETYHFKTYNYVSESETIVRVVTIVEHKDMD